VLWAAVTEAGREDWVKEELPGLEGVIVNTLEPLVVRNPAFVVDEELRADAADIIAGTMLVGYVADVPLFLERDDAVLDADVT